MAKNSSNNEGKKNTFSFEVREKLLENNKNSGKTQGKKKYRTAVNPASVSFVDFEKVNFSWVDGCWIYVVFYFEYFSCHCS